MVGNSGARCSRTWATLISLAAAATSTEGATCSARSIASDRVMLAANAAGVQARIAVASTAADRWRQDGSMLQILTAARQLAKLMEVNMIVARGSYRSGTVARFGSSRWSASVTTNALPPDGRFAAAISPP